MKGMKGPSGIDWQQKISSALGCRPGEFTYPLEECVAKIKELREGGDNGPQKERRARRV